MDPPLFLISPLDLFYRPSSNARLFKPHYIIHKAKVKFWSSSLNLLRVHNWNYQKQQQAVHCAQPTLFKTPPPPILPFCPFCDAVLQPPNSKVIRECVCAYTKSNLKVLVNFIKVLTSKILIDKILSHRQLKSTFMVSSYAMSRSWTPYPCLIHAHWSTKWILPYFIRPTIFLQVSPKLC